MISVPRIKFDSCFGLSRVRPFLLSLRWCLQVAAAWFHKADDRGVAIEVGLLPAEQARVVGDPVRVKQVGAGR